MAAVSEVGSDTHPIPPNSLALVRQRFTEAWHRGERPALADFLPDHLPERASVLGVLARTELELRLQAGEGARVEEYLQRHPELAACREVVLDLVAAEYYGRQQESDLTRAAYERRFPQYADALRRLDKPHDPSGVAHEARETVRTQVRDPAGETGVDPEVTGPEVPGEKLIDSVQGRRSRNVAHLPEVPGYEIVGELGRGGMGVVYQAVQTQLKRVVALKTILAGAQAGEEELARFRLEAEAVAQLHHPNIVQVYEVGEHRGLSYFSLEFMEGGSLSAKVREQPLTALEAAELVGTLSRAIHHAHQKGIIHRDLKPGNVLLSADGLPKVADFGLAKQVESNSGQTRTGAVLGTPSYMAPEQAGGRIHEIGPRTDVYALGAVLYRLLTGRPPFKGATMVETLDQVRSLPPVPPRQLRPRVPRDLETICLKCLLKEPDRRYDSARALANDLERFQAGEPIRARREGPLGKLWRRLRQHPISVAASAAAVLMIMAAFGTALYFRDEGQTADRIAVLQRDIRDRGNIRDAGTDWSRTAGQLAEVEGLIAELGRLAPQEADAEQKLLGQHVEEVIAGQILLPLRQGDGRVVWIQNAIAFLGKQNPEAASRLKQQLETRLRQPELAFDLKAPFVGHEAVFAQEQVGIEGDSLVSRLQPGNLVLTRTPCPGDAELKAMFRLPSWEQADRVGLALNATADGRGYQFLLHRQDLAPAGVEGVPTGRSEETGKQEFRLQIVRNGVVLREQHIPLEEIPAGVLQLWAKRAGDRLQCRLNDHDVLEFDDHFPLGPARKGGFGVVWPEGMRLESLLALRPAQAANPTLLEQGDELYEQGRFDEARAYYRQQYNSLQDDAARQQARYKEGLCLVALKRLPEARPVFQEVAIREGQRWPTLANCQLLLILLEENFPDETAIDSILARLHARGLTFQELAKIFPANARARLVPGSTVEKDLYKLLFHPKQAVQQARLHSELTGFFGRTRRAPFGGERALMHVYAAVGEEEKVLQLGEKLLAQASGATPHWDFRTIVEQLTWVQRLRPGGPAQALHTVDRWLRVARRLKEKDFISPYLWVERARTLVKMGKTEEAKQALAQFWETGKIESNPQQALNARLIEGFLCKAENDEGARAAWQQGVAFYRAREGKLGALTRGTGEGTTSVFLAYFIMAALTDDLDDAEARKIRTRLFARLGGEGQGQHLAELLFDSVPLSVYQQMWRTPLGQKTARQIAFREVSYAEHIRLPAFLFLTQVALQGSFADQPTSGQDQLVWNTLEAGYTAYLDDRIDLDQFAQAVLVWKGGTVAALLGTGLPKNLGPELRGPTAYLCGCRRLYHDKDPHQARTFFETALKDSSTWKNKTRASQFRRLIRAELERLEPKAPREETEPDDQP